MKQFLTVVLFVPWLCGLALASGQGNTTLGGHTKYQYLLNAYPEDSVFYQHAGDTAQDYKGDLRLKLDWRSSNWNAQADYQLTGQYGDSSELSRALSGFTLSPNRLLSDQNRLFDLTHVLKDEGKSTLVHRLDRLNIGYTGSQGVIRVGRQAVSWGNGLIYTPLDFFNPFDPTAVDKEYKTGDDMIYSQYLFDSGSDMQGVWVFRRDDQGHVSSDVNSISIKYHGFVGESEYDLLVAEHFDETIVGVGAIHPLGGAILRGDLTYTDTDSGGMASLVGSLFYSWVWFDKNYTGIVEYFHNGFGIDDGDYSPDVLAANTGLVDRYIRGELFTLGKHYLGSSLTVELSPLWLVTPNVFMNLSDQSFLLQIVSQHDLKENWQLLLAFSLPVGSQGTEFGGIESGTNNLTFANDFNIFAQLGWYF